jgi:hypothetical protein
LARGGRLPGPYQTLAVFVNGEPSEAQVCPYLRQQRLVKAKEGGEGAVQHTLVALEQTHHPEEQGLET